MEEETAEGGCGHDASQEPHKCAVDGRSRMKPELIPEVLTFHAHVIKDA
jgi:hypothetical protein